MTRTWFRAGVAISVGVAVGCGASAAEPAEVGEQALVDPCLKPTIETSGYLQSGQDGAFSAYVSGAACADGVMPAYSFTLRDPHNKVVATQDDPWASYFEVQLPAGSPEGTYTVSVGVHPGGAVDAAATRKATIGLGAVCRYASLNATPSWVDEGGIVTLEPWLDCDPGVTAEWQVVVTKPGGGTLNLGWHTEASIDWDTAGVTPGQANLKLKARAVGNRVSDVTISEPYSIGRICSATDIRLEGSDTTRTVSATASCLGRGVPEFRFTLQAPDGSVRELRGFDTSPQLALDTTGLNGTFQVIVEVRGVSTPTQPVSTLKVTAKLGDACTSVKLADTWGVYTNTGSLSLVASATCHEAEYQFQLKALGATQWTTICPYSTQATCDVPLAELAISDYLARAQVRNLGSIAKQDAASGPRDFVLSDGGATVRLIRSDWGWTAPIGLSANGRWVVGNGGTPSALFRWSRTTGFTDLGRLVSVNFSSPAQAQAVSDNGGVVVGWALGASQRTTEPFRWESGKMVSLDPTAIYASGANGVNAKGNVVVGSLSNEAFRWSAEGGLVRLGDLPGGSFASSAQDVSADGNVVVGTGRSDAGTEAVRWTLATGLVSLGDLPGGAVSSSARSVSRDGNVIVGTGTTDAGSEAFRWSEASGMIGLGLLPGSVRSLATGVSANGNVVIGATFSAGNQRTAFYWTPEAGMRPLKDVLLELGAPVESWNIAWAADISADGKTIIGTADIPDVGNDVGWLAMLP